MKWIAGGVAAAIVVVLLGLAASPARALTDAPRADPTASNTAPTVKITHSTPVLTEPDQRYSVTVQVTNTTARAWVGDINLAVATDPFEDRAALEAWAELKVEDVVKASWPVKAVPAQRLEPGETRTLSIEATARGEDRMNLGARGEEPGWGPRGVAVVMETARGSVAADRTYVVYAPEEAVTAPLALSVTAGLTAAPGETRVRALERITRVADMTAEPWIAWLADPALLVPSGTEADDDIEALAATITEAVEGGKTVYQLPFQDIDEAVLAQSGSSAQDLAAAARRIGRSALADAVGEATATRTATNVAWAERPVSQAAVDFMASTGADAVLLAPRQFDQPVAEAVVGGPGGAATIATDQDLTEALAGDGRDIDRTRILAQTALVALKAQLGGYKASTVAAMPRDWDPDESAWGIVEALADANWVRAVPLAAAINEPVERDRKLQDDSAPALKAESLRELLAVTDRTAAFASLTPDPEAYLGRSLPPLLVPLSNSVSPSGRSLATKVALTDAATAVPPVSVVAGSEVNLISEDGRVPVVIQNTSNEPVTGLVVDLQPRTNAIQANDPVRLDLVPGQSATARVPVHAVANGVFQVDVDLLDSAGNSVAEGASLTMRVRAEWENIGTGIAGGVLALVLALGVITTVRKRRAQARGEVAEPDWADGLPADDQPGDRPRDRPEDPFAPGFGP
ncbi:MAG: DUF6049 family protein [Bifidobacteriaceae bacterium]|jgi:hypothetical protein|nr:DUF6049 family protein [Bifidobacteriaceae bacterium]